MDENRKTNGDVMRWRRGILTGDGVYEVEGVGEAAEVDESPIEGVLAVGAVIDGYQNVPAPPSLPGLPLQLRLRRPHHRDNDRQLHFSPAVLLFLSQRLHLSLSLSLPWPKDADYSKPWAL